MHEKFLHFLWRWRRFDLQHLATTDGQPLEIVHPGQPNTDAGPDFFNARVRIGDTEWAGNVEMHLRASEWLAHRHDSDPAYDNVVLHVVLDEDQRILRTSGERLPCLTLRDRIPAKILENYLRLEHERAWVPCAQSFAHVPDIVRLNWLDRLLVERLEQKTASIAAALAQTENHWEEVFYRSLARNFGLKVNAQPFEMLALALPLGTLAKHKSNLLQVEALLFGQAGFLDEIFADEYPNALAKEYKFLRQKFDLQPLAPGQWKFLRLRPANFPTLRLAQFAGLIHRSAHLFSKILEAKNVRELEHLFDAPVSDYWQTHYQFDRPTARRGDRSPGRDFVHLLVVNTVVSFLFHYGAAKNLPEFRERALRLLEELPPESNTIVDGWAALGLRAKNAYQTQALLELKGKYCDARRCLECAVGNAVLR